MINSIVILFKTDSEYFELDYKYLNDLLYQNTVLLIKTGNRHHISYIQICDKGYFLKEMLISAMVRYGYHAKLTDEIGMNLSTRLYMLFIIN